MPHERHFQANQLSLDYDIPQVQVRELLLQWAQKNLIGLKAWHEEGRANLEWHQWPNPDDMFFVGHGDYVIVNILAAGSALVADLPKHSIGFGTA